MKSPDVKPYVVIHARVIITPRASMITMNTLFRRYVTIPRNPSEIAAFSSTDLLYNAIRPFFQGCAGERSEFCNAFLFMPIPARSRLIIEPSRIVSGLSSTIFYPASRFACHKRINEYRVGVVWLGRDKSWMCTHLQPMMSRAVSLLYWNALRVSPQGILNTAINISENNSEPNARYLACTCMYDESVTYICTAMTLKRRHQQWCSILYLCIINSIYVSAHFSKE